MSPEDLLAQARRLNTLADVLTWSSTIVSDVIVQDEYTHDVVLPHPSGHWLVFDTT